MRRLGIDPGSARTGLSVADDDTHVATPLSTLVHTTVAEAARKIAEVIAAEGIGEVVVGLPLAMNGRQGEAARRAKLLVERLQTQTNVPCVFWDERLSTASAERALRAQGVKGEAKRGVVDQAAATLILQSYLDANTRRAWDDEFEPDDISEYPVTDQRKPRRTR